MRTISYSSPINRTTEQVITFEPNNVKNIYVKNGNVDLGEI